MKRTRQNNLERRLTQISRWVLKKWKEGFKNRKKLCVRLYQCRKTGERKNDHHIYFCHLSLIQNIYCFPYWMWTQPSFSVSLKLLSRKSVTLRFPFSILLLYEKYNPYWAVNFPPEFFNMCKRSMFTYPYKSLFKFIRNLVRIWFTCNWVIMVGQETSWRWLQAPSCFYFYGNTKTGQTFPQDSISWSQNISFFLLDLTSLYLI